MAHIKHLLNRISFAGQMALVICLFALLPTLALAGYLMHSTYAIAMDARCQELSQRTSQLSTQVEKAGELCNMSTQVFLNTPSLIEHLALLKTGAGIHGQELKDFYDNDIASLEKVVVGNPYLYEIRVYAETDEMSELVPILYSASRMERMPWADQPVQSGTWQLDFDDQLFPSYAVTHHVMSLVTEITTADAGKVGTLEVALRMDSILPDLFRQSDEEWAVLVDSQGQVLVGDVSQETVSAVLDGQDLSSPAAVEAKCGRQIVLLSIQPLAALNCVYVQVSSLSDLWQQMFRTAAWILAALCVLCLCVAVLVRLLCRRMLRQFYLAFEAVGEFSQGDLNATVPVAEPDSEVGRFALGINEMLDRTRQLMRDNVNRELLGKNAELRALQNQINAHFIYNVLEAIKMMAEIDEKYEIADAVTNLGKLLRYSMRWTRKNVTIAEEIENIRNYLALMNLRFDNEITLKLDLPAPQEDVPDILAQTIPKMSLQPVVENAVVHGMEGLEQDAEILLRAVPDPNGDGYWLEIIDHGRGMSAATVEQLEAQIAGEIEAHGGSGNGIGLKNVQDRIQMAFGVRYGLSVSSEEGRFTCVAAHLPYTCRKREGESHENRTGGGR